ncbi:dihydrolipoyl dehydrogenase family protein [Spirosoma fluviale]|uniref:Glutathione reductase (NADPH) n=1 Tax=Spirosoma fluviale TaxID=1597977 RepID=A0A286FAV2_9BACT|nr:NAD(P)/FAD-dependent oxidoreductase [Spirosoma fluviale]SOD80367.1 glutathione reductase (NADPH) [Spirosoma fluviale]
MLTFDLIVVGTGSAGATVAQTAREAGKSVAIIDKLPFGGTCSQRGCDPKKVLVGAAEIVARSEQLTDKGITKPTTVNWADLMRFKKTFTSPIPERTQTKFSDLGIQTFHGSASFLSASTIRVGEDELTAKHIVLATGLRPQLLNIPGEELLIDSTGFLELPELPANIVMVGGGYIAFEFAHIAARAGANVTILHQGQRPLEGFDADLVKLLVKAMESIGIHVVLGAKVIAVQGNPDKQTVWYEQNEKEHTVLANVVVHAAGRIADVAELNLEKAGIRVGKKGVTVNEYLQSVSNPGVYACGDVADKGLPLTPLASYEGRIVAGNILNGNNRVYEDTPVPTAVFTIPTLASVGLTEEQAKEKGLKIKVTFQETSDWYSSRRINESFTAFKTIVDAQTDQILGAHLLGTGSEEVINLFTLAIKHQITAKDLRNTLLAYPTHGSDLSSMLPED